MIANVGRRGSYWKKPGAVHGGVLPFQGQGKARHRMRTGCVLLLGILLAGCAAAPPAPPPDGVLQDDRFSAPSERVSAADVFALSDDMRSYLKQTMAGELRARELRRRLIDALYNKSELKLDYDAEITRNAAQTFAARAGNCLSLVIMTAAFAKALGLPVRYQQVLVDEAWSRSDGMDFASSHVNLTLGATEIGDSKLNSETAPLTVDFLEADQIRGRHLRVIDEHTVVAMYLNNRAAETLARGQVNDAYWWARAAIKEDARFLDAYNTLGLVYRHHGDLPQAEAVLRRVLEAEATNTEVMSNLALVLTDEGRLDEARTLTRRLRELQPQPPFYYFDLGMEAMRKGDFKTARELFQKEVDRDPYYHKFHFWLAAAYLHLGQLDDARRQLALAVETSTTRKEHALYAAKLDWITANHGR